jgi:hypothetical protein
MRRWLIVGALVGFVLSAGGAALAVAPAPIRGIYIGADQCTDDLLDALANVGIKTLFCVYNGFEPEENLRPVLERARARGMRVFWAMFFHGGPEIARGFENNPRRFVLPEGTVTQRTNCPLDPIYWERAAAERALVLAGMARQDPAISGIAYDVEMYEGAADAGWDTLCYCDDCLAEFFRSIGRAESPQKIVTTERVSWLEAQGLTDAYAQFQHQGVRRITKDIADRAHAIDPGFAFALLPYTGACRDDIIAGFGTAEAPVLVMGEDTYSAGYRRDVEGTRRRLAQSGLYARVVTGFWLHKRPPEEWIAHAYLSSTQLDGYWLYEEFPFREILLASDAALREQRGFEGEPQEWRSAFARANREADAVLADPTHAPDVPLLPLRRPDWAFDFAAMPLETSSPELRAAPREWKNVGCWWSGAYLDIPATAAGQSVRFALPEGLMGPHRVRLWLACGPDHGMVQAYLDGEPVGQPTDTYASRYGPAADLITAQMNLGEHPHDLRLEVVGKSPSSSGFRLGADCLYLDYLGAFCDEWMVIGPFPNPEHHGYHTPWAPEIERDLEAFYAGRYGQNLRWQPARAGDRGMVNLAEMLEPNEWVVAYALTHVYSERERVARMLVGSDDGIKVWVNGSLVWGKLAVRGLDPDADRFPVRLRAGWNEILCKVEQGEGKWGVRLRVTWPDGCPRYAAVPPSLNLQ